MNTWTQADEDKLSSHIVSRRLRPDGVLCSEGDAAHSDDRQDAELKVLQSQDVVAALPKPGTNTQPSDTKRFMLKTLSASSVLHKYTRVCGGHDEAGAEGRHGFGAISVASLIFLLLLLLTLLLVGVGVLIHWDKTANIQKDVSKHQKHSWLDQEQMCDWV